MNISIIGSGNVATILSRLLKQNNFVIDQVVSRNKLHAQILAKELNSVAVDHISALHKSSDVYIIAVNDDSIETVSNELFVDEKIVVHTCGSVPMNVLNRSSKNFGVLYPLQSLRKEILYLPFIPFLTDANNSYSNGIITNLAKSVSKNVTQANDVQRMQFHISAVIVSNFTNHLFALTQKYFAANNIEFSLLLPLINETVNRLYNFHAAEMQTGPAMRNDELTMQKHIALLKDSPQLKNIYEMMSNSIIQSNKK